MSNEFISLMLVFWMSFSRWWRGVIKYTGSLRYSSRLIRAGIEHLGIENDVSRTDEKGRILKKNPYLSLIFVKLKRRTLKWRISRTSCTSFFLLVWLNYEMQIFLLLNRSQFHQHFTLAFFLLKQIEQLFSSCIRLWTFLAPKFHTKNALVKRWWNWCLNAFLSLKLPRTWYFGGK